MRKALQLFAVAVLVAACGSSDETAVEEPTPPPAPEVRTEPDPDPVPEPVDVVLDAELSADGDTVTVAGVTNLPDGAVLVWELTETLEAFALNPDVTLRDADGEVLAGEVTVADGAYRVELSDESWIELGLCDALPLELFVTYMPMAGVAALGAVPEQPAELYELHGDNGERIPGAVAPADLVEMSGGERRVGVFVECP